MCKHLNVVIAEEYITNHVMLFRNGEFVEAEGEAGDLTGRVHAQCSDCHLEKTYTYSKRPKWVIELLEGK